MEIDFPYNTAILCLTEQGIPCIIYFAETRWGIV